MAPFRTVPLTACLLLLTGQLLALPANPDSDRVEDAKLCGVRKAKKTADDSEETSLGEFPWMVDLGKKTVKTDLAQCGASIIRKDVILTTASCVLGAAPKDLYVRAGLWDRRANTTDPLQSREAARILIHEGYNKTTPPYPNDAALVFLKEPFVLGENVGVVCLPEDDERTKLDKDNCLATGWGFNYIDGESPRVKLRKVQLPLVDHDTCEKKIADFGKLDFKVHESFICAGGSEKDTCLGDGGSPMVCPIAGKPDRYVQLGMVAWGISCNSYLPSGYSSVLHHLPWITKSLSS